MTSTSTERPRDALAALRINRAGESTQRPRGGRFWKWLIVGLLTVAAGGAGFIWALRSGWLGELPAALGVPEAILRQSEVRVTRVEVRRGQSGEARVVAAGYLESRHQAKIGARVPGRIEALYVEEGSVVKRDDVLAVLEHAELLAVLAAAEASAQRARAALGEHEIAVANYLREFNRAQKLRESSSISELEYDRTRFQYESAVARIDSLKAEIALADARVMEARQMKENMFVRAPFDGTVISKDAEVGESILPGGMGEASGRGSVVTIADMNHLEVDCDVKEDFISGVYEGQRAEVSVDAVPDRRYAGKVRKIIPMGDRARATIKVKVSILDSDGRLFPEMSGRVFFLPKEVQETTSTDQRRLFVPRSAIVTEPGGDEFKPADGEADAADAEGTDAEGTDAEGTDAEGTDAEARAADADADVADVGFVWLVDDQRRVHRREVRLGPVRDSLVEVLEGLEGPERLVVEPGQLREGQMVRVVEQ